MSKHAWNWKITTPNEHVTTGVACAVDVREALAAALGTPAGVGLTLAHGIGEDDLVEMPGASDIRQLFTGKGCEILLERADAGGAAAPSLWHYTAGHKLQLIRESCALHPNGAKVAPNERPVVWFSADAVYEPTAIKLLQMPGQARLRRPTVAELHELVGVFRFAIDRDDPRLAAWPAVHRKARISTTGVANMIRAGVEIGAKPMNWFGALEEIPLADLRFEAWTGEHWVAAQIDASIAQIRERMELVRSISAAAYGPAGIKRAWQAGANA
ncbi:hypothetical protein [Massilia orientalis]|uniref:Uncharacterized protein n=1 Tax=Massilia orientalis TaxID=3050128 RepID=A0ACC7ME49_9BURK|nr:hypothetical protein [Massilia sp. YIM B02787]